jgi:putative MATE family efflux protein
VPAKAYDRSITEGPLGAAVWKIAWPTMLTNIVGGLQGIVDHVAVGRLVGFHGNAAIGVSWQIWIIIIVFISSLFTGMSVLVSRFVGANEREKVDRTVYQAFLTAMVLSVGVMAPVGYLLAPWLLTVVNATPEVTAEALPFLRVMFLFSSGMLLFFMLSGALRAAGDARTPMKLGLAMTLLNIGLNVILIRGLGPVPAFGTTGAAMGTVMAAGVVSLYAVWRLVHGGWVVHFPKGQYAPDWDTIRALFRFGLPTGVQGIAMNVGGMLMLGLMGSLPQSAEAQAAFAIGYSQLFSLVTWTAMGLLGAAATVAGQNLGAGQPERAVEGVATAARFALTGAAVIGVVFLLAPGPLLGLFGVDDPTVRALGSQLLRVMSVSGLFISVALTYTGGLQGTGDTKSPLYISLVSQVAVPLGLAYTLRAAGLLTPLGIWVAILLGHFSRGALSYWRFQQGAWRRIHVDITAPR